MPGTVLGAEGSFENGTDTAPCPPGVTTLADSALARLNLKDDFWAFYPKAKSPTRKVAQPGQRGSVVAC